MPLRNPALLGEWEEKLAPLLCARHRLESRALPPLCGQRAGRSHPMSWRRPAHPPTHQCWRALLASSRARQPTSVGAPPSLESSLLPLAVCAPARAEQRPTALAGPPERARQPSLAAHSAAPPAPPPPAPHWWEY
eukprot:1767165-Prymnesium_polylepis.1